MTEKQEKEKLIGPHVNCVGLFKIFKTFLFSLESFL